MARTDSLHFLCGFLHSSFCTHCEFSESFSFSSPSLAYESLLTEPHTNSLVHFICWFGWVFVVVLLPGFFGGVRWGSCFAFVVEAVYDGGAGDQTQGFSLARQIL